jgi:hypothetical protein
MRSAFDSPARIEDGVVEACGKLEWESGETEAHVTVMITQHGQKLVGTASSPPGFSRPEDEWMLEVQPSAANREFEEGPAHAMGIIHTIKDDGVDVFRWEQDIVLDPDVVDEDDE